MKIKDIIAPLEEFAPPASQEGYDNSGLVVGRPDDDVTAALLCVDVTEEVLDEAVRLGARLVISHHPIIFHPLKRLNGVGHVERIVERAVRENIALYACHTNLDRAVGGMSFRLAEILGLESIEVLDPDGASGGGFWGGEVAGVSGFGAVGELSEPIGMVDFLRKVARKLGVGCIRHSAVDCGIEARRGGATKKELEADESGEVENGAQNDSVAQNVDGGTEEKSVAEKRNTCCKTGSGGELTKRAIEDGSGDKMVRRVAVVTGSGGELIERAIEVGADLFLTADVRYDRFFTAGRIVIADIGHFESEFCAIELMHEVISKKIATFALHKSESSRNPVSYLV
jgi:dinuclear metal center YbgI/SA1388 family protein